MRIPSALSAALCALLFSLAAATAQVIDFETTPTATIPADDSFLATAYNLTGGGTVSFFFDANTNYILDAANDRPVFEAYGPDGNDAFSNDALSTADTANGGLASQLGTRFLRQFQPGSPPPQFIVDYNTPQVITGLHGEIWDIDGAVGNTEIWQVDILDASNALLAAQTSPVGNSAALDGLPWVFSFSGLPSGVDKVRITFTGSKLSGLGLAFNNFDPTKPVPEPGAATLLTIGIAAFTWRRRRGTLRR